MNSIIIAVLAWLICVGLLFFCVYVISKHAGWFEQHSLKLLITSLLLGLGIYFFGYYFRDSSLFGGNQASGFSLTDLAASALLSYVSMSRMLVMELDIGELGVVGEIPLFRILYGVVLLSTICFLATAVLSMLGGRMLSRIRISFFRRFGSRHRIYIIYGFRPEMSYFVKDIRKQHPDAQIIIFFPERFEEDNKELMKDLAVLGCMQCSVGEHLTSTKDYAIPKKRIKEKVFFLSAFPETEKNLETVTALCGILKKERCFDLPIHIYGLISYEICGEIPLEHAYDGFSVHWTDLNQLGVRQVFLSHPLTDSIPRNHLEEGCLQEKIEIAVFGYSPEAPYLYRSLLEEVQFKGVDFRLILLGENISDKTADFRHMNPGIYELAEIECADIPLMSDDFYKWLKTNKNRIFRFYCMAENDSANLHLQRVLCTMCKTEQDPEIYVLSHRKSPLWDEERVYYFGTYDQIFTEALIIHEKLDQLAAAVHTYYQMYYGADEETARKSWLQTTVFNKEASRSLALHLPSKLYSMGYRLDEEKGSSDYQQYLKEHPLVVENLAVGEHLRWEMFFFNRGWTFFPGELPDAGNKDMKNKYHACLVPWNQLKKIGEKYGTDYQYLDEHFIRNLDKIAELAGFGLRKISDDR